MNTRATKRQELSEPTQSVRSGILTMVAMYLVGHTVELITCYFEDGGFGKSIINPNPLCMATFTWGMIAADRLFPSFGTPRRQWTLWCVATLIPFVVQLSFPYMGGFHSVHNWYVWSTDIAVMFPLFFAGGVIMVCGVAWGQKRRERRIQ